MPTLREREDLKWLINRILAKQHKGQKESITTISLEAEQVLLQYKWPGNIRQLENILELAKLLGEGRINLKDLPEEIQFGGTRKSNQSRTIPAACEQKLKRFHSRVTGGNELEYFGSFQTDGL